MTAIQNIDKEKDIVGHDKDIEHNVHDVNEPRGDAVFGEITEKGPDYRNVGWVGSTILMCKSMIGLGVLSIPYVFQTIGLVPGVIVILIVAGIVTWSDYVVYQIKMNHPDVYGLPDVGRVLYGRIGEEFLAISFCTYMIFVSGSGMVGISTALNAVSHHGACTAIFIAVAAILGMMLASIQTLGRITWLGWIGMVSIMSAIITVTVSVGIQDRPAAAPQSGPWDKEVLIFGSCTFAEGIAAVAAVIFAYSGTPTYFGIIAEMRDPKRYPRSMFICQGFVTGVYLIIGIVVYVFCGQYVAYPALGSAGPLMKKICYGLAIPGLLVTLTIYTHIPAKYVFVRMFRGSRHLNSNTFIHWAAWLGCVFTCIFIAYIIASAIPIFGSLVSLIGAVFCPLMCMQPFGMMWLNDYWKGNTSRTTRIKTMAAFALFVIIIGNFLTIAGTYGAVKDIINTSSSNKPWTCADNSNTVSAG